MPFLLLLVLTPPCLQEVWPAPGLGMDSPGRSVLLTWAAVLFAILVSAVLSWRLRRQLAREPERRDRVLRRYSKGRLYHLFGLFAVYLLSLYVCGWGWAVQTLWGQFQEQLGVTHTEPSLPPGSELAILAPFLAALLGSWFCFYDVERALHETASEAARAQRGQWTRWQYLGHQVRHNLALVFIPVALLMI